MKKLLASLSIILFICANLTAVHAQDSVPKPKTPKVQTAPVVKPAASTTKPGYYKPKYNAYKKPGDSAATHPNTVYTHPVADTAHKATAPDITTDKSLSGQYQYLLTKVYYYQQPLLNAFHKSVMDTLALSRGALKAEKARSAAETKQIDSLQNALKATQQTSQAATNNEDSIDMFGFITLPKSTYNMIMWGLVVVFAVIAGIVIARTGSHKREAKYRSQLYDELDEEYKNYKLKANEKEKRLARELQTERNKLDELLGRG